MTTQTKPLSDQDIADLAARNEQRRKEAIQKLGDRWLLHPTNKIKKNDPTRFNAKSSPPRCILV